MAQTITCDAGDGRPAAYLVSDMDAGSTFATCTDHWIDFCAEVTRAAEAAIAASAPATAPEPVDLPEDPSDPDNDVQQADQLDGADDTALPDVVVTLPDDDDDDDGPGEVLAVVTDDGVAMTPDEYRAHEARVRAELAARPDAAATSQAVTWTGEDA